MFIDVKQKPFSWQNTQTGLLLTLSHLAAGLWEKGKCTTDLNNG
jgi:hypothetical protein